MKRVASGELDGSLQPSEKAAKEGDAVPQPVGANPLLGLLRSWTPAEAAALRWLQTLQSRDVWSLDDVKGLALDKGWEVFVQELRDSRELMLASKLSAWKQGDSFGGNSPGNHFFFHSSFALFWALALPSS